MGKMKMDRKGQGNYYDILESDRLATFEELKKSYQRLVLILHPDKTKDNNKAESFLRVQKAWNTLKDRDKRKLYDAELTCQENSDLLLYDTISIKDMEFEDSEKIYTYRCRCGGTYFLEETKFVISKIVIACDECSFSIQVNIDTLNCS